MVPTREVSLELLATITCKDPKWRQNPLLNEPLLTVEVKKCSEKNTTVLFFGHHNNTYTLKSTRGTDDERVGYARQALMKTYHYEIVSTSYR